MRRPHLRLAGQRLQTPRSSAARHIAGRGEIPLPALLRTIYESGYRSPYTLEIISQDVRPRSGPRTCRRSLRTAG